MGPQGITAGRNAFPLAEVELENGYEQDKQRIYTRPETSIQTSWPLFFSSQNPTGMGEKTLGSGPIGRKADRAGRSPAGFARPMTDKHRAGCARPPPHPPPQPCSFSPVAGVKGGDQPHSPTTPSVLPQLLKGLLSLHHVAL